MNRRVYGLPLAVAATLLAAACGGGDDSDAQSKGFKIALLMSVQGEDQFAIDGYANAAELAIKELNEDGGVDGKPIEYTRIPAPSDPQALTDAFLKAAEWEPDVMIGFPPPALATLTRQMNDAGIPILGVSSYAVVDGLPGGSKWLFQLTNAPTDEPQAAARFAVEQLGVKNIAVLHTNEAFGTTASDELVEQLADLDATVTARVGFAPTVTDMTQPVLETDGADAIIHFGYPGPMAVQLKTMVQQEREIPTITSGSGTIAARTGDLGADALAQLYATVPCNVFSADRPETAAFRSAYEEAYDAPPDYFAAKAYDAVHLAVAARDQAASSEPDDLADALSKITFEGGACAQSYSAAGNVMVRELDVVSFSPEGVQSTEAHFADLGAES